MCSQLSFRRNKTGIRCLVYQEDTVTKTNDGGLNHMRKDRKIVWVYPNDDPERCPVRIVDKYISLLPIVKATTKKHNFYLRSLDRPTPAQWYGEQVVGHNTLRSVMSEMSRKAGIDLFITDHSLRRTGTTRLFRGGGGVDRKLVKEYSGHSSDAVEAYQVTSDKQRESISRIIADDKRRTRPVVKPKLDIEVTGASVQDKLGCSCKGQTFDVSNCNKIGDMISEVLASKPGVKAKVKLEIEFC